MIYVARRLLIFASIGITPESMTSHDSVTRIESMSVDEFVATLVGSVITLEKP